MWLLSSGQYDAGLAAACGPEPAPAGQLCGRGLGAGKVPHRAQLLMAVHEAHQSLHGAPRTLLVCEIENILVGLILLGGCCQQVHLGCITFSGNLWTFSKFVYRHYTSGF